MSNGIIVGDFANTEPKKSPSLLMEEVFQHYFDSLTFPVMTGFNRTLFSTFCSTVRCLGSYEYRKEFINN